MSFAKFFNSIAIGGMENSVHYAHESDTNYYIVAARREIENESYSLISDKLMRHHNEDVKAIGKILASLPPKRGAFLIVELFNIFSQKWLRTCIQRLLSLSL